MIPCIEVCSAVLDLIVSPADHFFKNSFDPDQARQYVGPDLDPNRLTL